MLNEPLDEIYFRWLYRQVAPVRIKNPTKTYHTLLKQLHNKEFTWFVPNDDNRETDGRYLRYEFVEELPPRERLADDDPWYRVPCSMLEMMIALARRLAFLAGQGAHSWFWHLMGNLGLRDFRDGTSWDPNFVDEVLTRVIERTYERNGTGGLFPLRRPREDQRKLEIWYQMNEYLIENGRG